MSGTMPSRRSTNSASLPGRRRDEVDSVPQPLTTFIGRERDVATVADFLRRPDVRLLTVTGTGGVGKTRLALRATEAARDAFDSTAFVSLASVREPSMLLLTVAQHLNVPDAPDQPLLSRLLVFLADRLQLLVLDNLEHLLDAVPVVVDLLAGCPRLTILCTCRVKLNVSGEHLLPLDPLPGDEARALFVDRVRAVIPGFTLTDELRPVVDAICTRLDGLPLALELAASRVPALPPRALLARLEHRLDLLTNGPRDAPPRLRDMRDAIGWSHGLLPREQQILFRRLGVFIGGFTLAAAEAVASDEIDVVEAISALVAASLVVPIDGVADEPRYTMLETIREFALERLEHASEAPAVRARHAEYFQRLAEVAIPHYDGPDVRLASDRVDIELDNCRAAMAWALEVHDAETGLRLAGALWRIWWFAQATGGTPWRDRVSEGRDWIERMLPMREGLPVEALTEALIGGVGLAHMLGDDDQGHVLGEELLTRSRAEGYSYGEYWALGLLGITADARGDVGTARRYFEHALSHASDIRNPDNHAALAHLYLGTIALRAGNPEAAAGHLEKALKLSHDTGNSWLIALAAAAQGRTLLHQGDAARAATLTREGLLAFTEQRNLPEIHACLVDLALVALRADQPAHGARLLGVAGAFPSHEDEADYIAGAVADTQSRIGEAAFTAEFEAGRDLTWDEVLKEIDALIETLADTSAAPPPEPATTHGLSPREVEVLRLVAEGQSSRAIAETLFVSERTVETHIFHIFNKLNVNSRAAAAAHAVRLGLL
jgi:predicted ATPase/DNA-binding CsgD family transcriptional regulator